MKRNVFIKIKFFVLILQQLHQCTEGLPFAIRRCGKPQESPTLKLKGHVKSSYRPREVMEYECQPPGGKGKNIIRCTAYNGWEEIENTCDENIGQLSKAEKMRTYTMQILKSTIMPAVRMSTGSTSTTFSIVGTPSRIVANRTSNIMASKTSTNLLSLETTQAIQTSSYSEILVVEKSGTYLSKASSPRPQTALALLLPLFSTLVTLLRITAIKI